MKKQLLKITGTVVAIALVLLSTGCTSKVKGEVNEDDTALPTISEDDQAVCESGG